MVNLPKSFKIASSVALAGWAILILMPFWEGGEAVVLFLAGILLAALYGYVLRAAMKEKPEPGADKPGFSNWRGVQALFNKPTAILAAWIHILAFDLMIGLYIHQESEVLGISHWLMIPCYLLTLMFGPLGLLLFLTMSWFIA